MQIFNTRSAFPAPAGTMRSYAFRTTTPILMYSDKGCTQVLGYELTLTAAGWAPQAGIFTQEDATLEIVDIHGVTVLTLDITGSSGVAGLTAGTAETVAALKALDPASSTIVTVGGYNALGDCPSRVAVWKPDSVAAQDGGSVFISDISPTGRWHIIFSDVVDARCFGIFPGASLQNSFLSAAGDFCATEGKTLYFPPLILSIAGNATLTLDCAVHTAAGCNLSADAETTLVITKPSVFEGSFAAANVRMLLNGAGWENTIVPINAFSITAKGHCEGTARFILRIPDNRVYWFQYVTTFEKVIVDPGVTALVNSSAPWRAKTIEGAFNFSGSIGPVLDVFRTSTSIGALTGNIAATTKTELIVDSALTIPAWTDMKASILVVGAGSVTTAGTGVRIHDYHGPAGSFRGSDGYLVNHIVPSVFLPDTLMRTWNLSDIPVLDMQYASTSVAPTKVGKIVNAILTGGIESPSIHLVSCSVTGAANSTTVTAEFCDFSNPAQRPFPNLVSSTLTNCQLTGSTAIQGTQTISDARWTNVTYNSFLKCIGGGIVLTEVECKQLVLIPGATGYLSNVAIKGGKMELIDFSAAQQANAGVSRAQVVHISGVRGLQTGIRATSGATKYWAMSGHYSVIVTDNENARATKGSRRFVFESPTYSNFVYSGQVSTEGQILFLHPVALWPASEGFFSQYSISAQAMRTSDGYLGSYSTSVKGTIGLYAGRMVYVHAEIIGGAALAPETISLDWNLYP